MGQTKRCFKNNLLNGRSNVLINKENSLKAKKTAKQDHKLKVASKKWCRTKANIVW